MERILEVLLASLLFMLEDFKQKAAEIRNALGLKGNMRFPALHIITDLLGDIDDRFVYQIIDDKDWTADGINTLYRPASEECPFRVIYIRNSLFVRAEQNDEKAQFELTHEFCHWLEDFKYGIRIPESVKDPLVRKILCRVIELRTEVFTWYMFSYEEIKKLEKCHAKKISGSGELNSLVQEYSIFTEWRKRLWNGNSGNKPEKEKP